MERRYTLTIGQGPHVGDKLHVQLLAGGETVAENHPDTTFGIEDVLGQIGEALVLWQEDHREYPPDGGEEPQT